MVDTYLQEHGTRSDDIASKSTCLQYLHQQVEGGLAENTIHTALLASNKSGTVYHLHSIHLGSRQGTKLVGRPSKRSTDAVKCTWDTFNIQALLHLSNLLGKLSGALDTTNPPWRI